MNGFGQAPCAPITPGFMKGGPVDLDCGTRFSQSDDDCTKCLNEQNIMNSQVALDAPYMWTHRILPGVAVGLVVGFLIGKAVA